MDFPAHRKSSVSKLIFCKFCVYFSSRMRGIWVYVASVLRDMRATPGDGAWMLRVIYGQHTCIARYGRVNSVVNLRELRARCEGTWTYKNERFIPDIGKKLSVLGNQNDFQILQKTFGDLLMSEIIYRYWKLLFHIGYYFPKSWNTE